MQRKKRVYCKNIMSQMINSIIKKIKRKKQHNAY